MEANLKLRAQLLHYSLHIENMLSTFLADLVEIKTNLDETYSFSNKSSALSFSSKIHLLIDMGALNKSEKNKFFTFMEVRNQFVHNLNAYSYEQCVLKYLPEKKNFILSLHKPKKEVSLEAHLAEGVKNLAKDVMQLTIDILKKISERNSNNASGKFEKELMQEVIKQMNYYEENPPKNFMNLRKNTTYTKEQVRIIADQYVRKILGKAIDKVHREYKYNKKIGKV